MDSKCFYKETLSSKRTTVLFIILMLLFLLLSIWRVINHGFGFLSVLFIFLCVFFLFYIFNYRTLNILMCPEYLKFRFGIFSWKVSWDNIASARIDTVSIWRVGGAGIHFTWINRRYRIFMNFLEYSRVVLVLKEPMGWVWDVVFSTAQPAEVLDIVRYWISPPERKVIDEPAEREEPS